MLDVEGIFAALNNTKKLSSVIGKENELSKLTRYRDTIKFLSVDIFYGDLEKQDLVKRSINDMYGYASSICQEAKTESPYLTEKLAQSVKVLNALKEMA